MILFADAQVDVTDTGPPLWIFTVILAVLLVPYGVFLLRRHARRLPPDLPTDQTDRPTGPDDEG